CQTLPRFFFQAEDGIRDFHVTGVQTCALPISTAFSKKQDPQVGPGYRGSGPAQGGSSPAPSAGSSSTGSPSAAPSSSQTGAADRSEERRVGEEVRAGWATRPHTRRDRT